MIRVVYAWEVAPADFAAFREAWSRATRGIHEKVPGARGSFLLQDVKDPGSVLTIARWDSLKHWQGFWQGEDPAPMRAMRRLGRRISVQAYEEYGDFTV